MKPSGGGTKERRESLLPALDSAIRARAFDPPPTERRKISLPLTQGCVALALGYFR